jgi:hypothetical protein
VTVTKLNDVRDDATVYNNRLDTLLADVFSLLSLFFLTIGKTMEAPATYSQLASMRVSMLCLESGYRRPLVSYKKLYVMWNLPSPLRFHVTNNCSR